MDFNQQLSAIERLVSQGQIEPAVEQLVALLDRDPRGAELAQIARVNQADLYQLKAAVLKGTVAPDDARLTTNQITDSIFQIIRRASAGKFTLTDPLTGPVRGPVWRYYVAGGVVALAGALLAWRLLGGSAGADNCPSFDENTRYRVMVLPIKQTGTKKANQPEIDIADGLNVLIGKTPGLKNIAEADVYEQYDIANNYPSFSQAAETGEHCAAQMVVWGKLNQDEKDEYKLDIRYKLLGGNGAETGDTTLSNLLKMKDEGRNLSQDVEAVTRFLYIVLANQAHVPVLPTLIASAQPATGPAASAAALPDTTLLLGLAQNRANNHETDKAIETYTQILDVYPDNREARIKRGSLLYDKGDYANAARDLEAAAPNPKQADSDLLKIRVNASLRSKQPDKARDDLQLLRAQTPKTAADGTWLDNKRKEVQDSLLALQQQRDRMERMALSKPQDNQWRVGAAKASLGLGDTDRALRSAKKVIAKDPQNTEAVDVAVEAHLQKGDTASAQRVIESAERAGAKSVQKWKGVVRQLPEPNVKKDKE